MAGKKKHGPPINEKKRKLKDIKNSTYRDSCGTGYQAQGKFMHAHHIVPCCSMAASISDYFDSKKPVYRRALYYFTDWDINSGANLVGLPTLSAYEASFRGMRRRNINVGRPHWYIKVAKLWQLLAEGDVRSPKYPIHSPSNFGHTDYNDNVVTALNKIWSHLSFQEKNHQPVNANSLAEEIQGISDAYRGSLMAKTGQRIEDWDSATADKSEFYMV
jgi:hypothetical protein